MELNEAVRARVTARLVITPASLKVPVRALPVVLASVPASEKVPVKLRANCLARLPEAEKVAVRVLVMALRVKAPASE